MKQKAIICDLDGTLYDARARQEIHLLGPKKDFDAFHRDAENDDVHFWCAQLLQAMRNQGFQTVFTSGRDDTYRPQTVDWINRHLLWKEGSSYCLFMRPAGNYTPDDQMKEDWYRSTIEPNFEVLFAIDDRKRVAQMWRKLGITCLHCAEGDF